MPKLPNIDINNVNLGGIADSPYLGAKNSVDDMLGFDIHSESGVMKVNQALTKESGTTVDEIVRVMVPCSDGNTYLFGQGTGKIWKRTSGGTYSLEATNANGAIYGAIEYQGYVYYLGSQYMGRWQIGTAWSTRTDSYLDMIRITTNRPCIILNGVFYFGTKYKVGQKDGAVVDLGVLILEENFTVTALGQMGTDLLVGTSNTTGTAQIFRWNTWSVSFTNSDPVPETAINSFLPMDNFVLCNAGNAGNIYVYNGVILELYKKIRLDPSAGSAAQVLWEYASINFNGKALLGFSVVWSLARTNRNYPFVLNKEVGCSNANYTTNKICSMIQPSGADYFLVAWSGASNTFGVDKHDSTLKFTGAYIQSRIIMADRYAEATFGEMSVAWRTKPANTAFTFSTKKNNGTMTALTPATDQLSDTDRNKDYTKADIGDAETLQVKVAVTPSSNTAPEIESIRVAIK